MENLENNVVNEEVQDVEVQVEKTFTQDDIDKIVNKRLARERKDIEARIEAEKEEAKKLAKMDADEKAKFEFDKQVKEFEETKKAFESERLLNETTRQLDSKKLPIQFAEMLKGVDAETTFENIKKFEDGFNSEVEKRVSERLKGSVPKASVTNQISMGKDEFNKMNMVQRQKLFMENRELYNELTN